MMKKLNFLYKKWPLLFLLIGLSSCKKGINDIEKVQEQLVIDVSSASIALDENNPARDIITFKWKPARPQSDDHLVSYTTKLDVVGNNFGSSTAIMNYEDDGTVSRSFTSEQLQNWANQKWGIPVNKPFTVEFRVVAQWEGGATFEAPEVRTVKVNVTPIKTVVFDADKVFLGGSAVPGLSKIEMTKTLENLNQYAYVLNLQPGELQIPVEYNNATNYISSADASTAVNDGVTISARMRETAFSWKIETAGQYRVVVNMQKATATIYSPAQALKPAVVMWTLDGVMQTTEVNNLFEYGESVNNWSWRAGNWKQSLADPQIFVYTGPALSGRTKFGVAAVNQSYVFTGNNTGANTSVTLGVSYPLSKGYATLDRNSYFSLPSGTNSIILDLRNLTMVATKK